MKKTALFILAAFGLALFTTGCQFQLPQKISVKSEAEYNFSLMNVEKDLNEFVSVDKISSMIPATTNMKVYDYNPGGNSNTQQYLLEVPIGNSIDLNFSNYFNQDLLNGDPIEFTQKFTVPQVNFQKSGTQSLSAIGSKLTEAVKLAGPALASYTVPAVSSADFAFSSLTFSAGNLVIYTDGDAGTVTVSQAGGLSGSAALTSCTPVTKTAGGTSVTATYKAEIPLTGKTLKNNGTLEVAFSVTGVATGFYMEVESGNLSSADGVKFTVNNSDISPSPETLTDPLPSMVDSIKIGAGTITTSVTPPTGWTGCNVTLKVKTSGLIDQSTAVSTLNLSGKTLTKGNNLTVTPEVTLAFNNAHLDFSNSDLSYEVKAQITNISEAKLKENDLFGGAVPSISKDITLPTTVTDIVKEIKLGASTIDIVSTSTLPAGNDITVAMSCVFLNLSDSFVFGNNKTLTAIADTVKKSVPVSPSTISFAGTVTMPGSAGGYTTLKNLEPGKEYTVYVKATPKIVWNEIWADSNSLSSYMPNTEIETGIKIADLISGLPSDVKNLLKTVSLKKAPAYIYVSKPEMALFDSIEMKGTIELTDGVSAHKVTFGDGNAFALKNVPDLEKRNKVVVTDLSKIASSLDKDIKALLCFDDSQSGLEQLKVKPSITLTGAGSTNVKIEPSDLENKNTTLKVVAYIVLPMDLEFGSAPNLDILALVGQSGNDVFQGALSSMDTSKINDYLDVIESVEVSLDVTKIPLEFTGTVPVDPADPSGPKKDLNVAVKLFPGAAEEGDHTLTLKDPKILLAGSEVKKIFENKELKPEVKVIIPDGNMTVSRAMSLGAVVNLKIKTNGKITVFDQAKK